MGSTKSVRIPGSVIATIAALAWLFSACATTSPIQRVFLDSSTHEDSPPNWAKTTKLVWEKDGKIFLRGHAQCAGR